MGWDDDTPLVPDDRASTLSRLIPLLSGVLSTGTTKILGFPGDTANGWADLTKGLYEKAQGHMWPEPDEMPSANTPSWYPSSRNIEKAIRAPVDDPQYGRGELLGAGLQLVAGMAPKVPAGQLNMMVPIGRAPKSVAELGWGTPEAAAATAKSKLTLDPQGMLLKEIEDFRAPMDHKALDIGTTHKLEDIIRHPELFDSVPELRRYKVSVEPGNGPYVDGIADPRGGHITLKYPDVVNHEDAREALFHEIQHAVQYERGMPNGSSPSLFKTLFEEEPFKSQIPNPDKYAESAYLRTYGEAQARATGMRALGPSGLTPLGSLLHRPPTESFPGSRVYSPDQLLMAPPMLPEGASAAAKGDQAREYLDLIKAWVNKTVNANR